MSFIRVKDLKKSYSAVDGVKYAVNGVSFDVDRGDFLAVSGPSGSGKSTLLNLLAGLDVPDSGLVDIEDETISSYSESQREQFRLHSIGFVFQSYNLIPVLSALENVSFVMELQGIPRIERERRSKEILENIGLADFYERRPHELSGGQQQRVAIARAMVSKPKIVLADEPTANLDSDTAKSLLDLMKKFNKENGMTFIFSTHDALVLSYAKRIIKLRDGSMVSDELV